MSDRALRFDGKIVTRRKIYVGTYYPNAQITFWKKSLQLQTYKHVTDLSYLLDKTRVIDIPQRVVRSQTTFDGLRYFSSFFSVSESLLL